MSEHWYLFRAKDARGRAVTDQVMGSSAKNAMWKLRESGFTDIELFADDVSSRAGEDSKRAAAIRRGVSPDIMIRMQSATRSQAKWLSIVNAYRTSGVMLMLLALFFVLRRSYHTPFAWHDYAFLVVLAVPIFIVMAWPSAGKVYQEIQRAAIEARHQDVLKLSAKLEPWLRKMGAPGILELAKWRARALINLGQKEAAQLVMELARNTPGLSQGAYQVSLASFYGNAQDLQRMRQCYEEAIRIEPNQPAGWLGLAELLATRLGGTTEARAALERLNKFALTADTRNTFPFIEAAIALNERRFDEARQKLDVAHADMVRRARTIPLAIANQRHVEALLTIACAGAGDRPAAVKYFAACEDFLRLHRDEDLLRRCGSALGGSFARDLRT